MRVYRAVIECVKRLDEETREADVTLRVAGQQYRAFCHPCPFEPWTTLAVTFGCLEDDRSAEEVLNGNPERVTKLEPNGASAWSYEAYGPIVRLRPLVVDCGGIELELYPRFRDERLIGEYVRVGISRLDVQVVHQSER